MEQVGRPLILVWNDEPAGNSLVEVHLVSAGYDIVRAGTVAEIRATLNEPRAPELVLLNRPDAAEEAGAIVGLLRGEASGRWTPVLALVPAEAEARLRALAAGVDDLLSHPVDAALLLARVRSLLETRRICQAMDAELQRFTQIGIALTGEHDLKRLLGRIVAEARAINNADAATLYSVDPEAKVLRFRIAQNESLGTNLHQEHDLPPVPLELRNVSAFVALTGQVVNIPDVYAAEGFDFSGPCRYDALTGYRSQSMLVVPIRDHEDHIISVLQLINAQDPRDGRIVPFEERNVQRTRALASQAGVALTNAQLITDLQALLEGLIQTLADAVDEKSSYTAGHIRRVTDLAVSLAEAVNDCDDGRFGGEQFDRDALEELRVAGLLHDIGKIVIPEHLADKATKLERVYDRLQEVRVRFSVIRRGTELEMLRGKLELVRTGAAPEALAALDADLAERLAALADDLRFVEQMNHGGESMSAGQAERLRRIASCTYRDDAGEEQPYLTPDELENLLVARGTLLPAELAVIRSHAAVSLRLLNRIPFPRKLRAVPTIASDHHEALDGSGYPSGKTAEALPLQSRILAVADVYDALTAQDRPYKKAFSRETAYRILRENAEQGKLDPRLVELFIEAECHRRTGSERFSAYDASPGDVRS